MKAKAAWDRDSIVDIGDRCGRHGGGSEGSHRGKNFSKTWYLWVTRRKIFINRAFWALFRQNSGA